MTARPPRRTKTVASAALPHEVRIVGGLWKRTRLAVLDRPGLRPTPARVRETLFNWLGARLDGWRCLDAFAGTGALGLEAASRGAAAVQLWERDAALVAQLQRVHTRLGSPAAVAIHRGDGLAALQRQPAATLELVLLDPPFDAGPQVIAAALRAAAAAVVEHGRVYLEAPARWDDAALAPLGLALHRQLKAGVVHAHLLTRLPLA